MIYQNAPFCRTERFRAILMTYLFAVYDLLFGVFVFGGESNFLFFWPLFLFFFLCCFFSFSFFFVSLFSLLFFLAFPRCFGLSQLSQSNRRKRGEKKRGRERREETRKKEREKEKERQKRESKKERRKTKDKRRVFLCLFPTPQMPQTLEENKVFLSFIFCFGWCCCAGPTTN